MERNRSSESPGERAADPDRLLDGEDPESVDPDDVAHWIAVYTELLQAKASMLAALNERLAVTTEPDARHEIAATDVVVLERELQRFQRRLDFWRERRAGPEDDPRTPHAQAGPDA